MQLLPARATQARPVSRHPPDDRLAELRLPPWAGILQVPTVATSSPPGLPCNKVSDAGAFRARDVDFVFIKMLFSRGFRWYA